jgi:hypothetical protein
MLNLSYSIKAMRANHFFGHIVSLNDDLYPLSDIMTRNSAGLQIKSTYLASSH